MRRREFIGLVGGVAAVWPRVALAQQSAAMPVIGFLNGIARDDDSRRAFRKGLAELGYLEGKNVAIEYRDANGIYDQLPHFAAELASLPVSLIVAVPSSPAAVAAKKATSAIPIVFFIGVDPVRIGLVASYNRPGGNATGVVLNSDELTAKRVELLRELLPVSVRLALLVNPSNPNWRELTAELQRTAHAMGRELISVSASTKAELETAFAEIDRQRVGGIVVWQEAYLTSERSLIVSLAARYAIPSIYGPRIFTEIGGLMSYGSDRNEAFRLAGTYAGKILQGMKPADLPVQAPTRYELVINLKTAKTLNLRIPPALLATADEVIE
jgi:putative ABC transport system substrate-binding protein